MKEVTTQIVYGARSSSPAKPNLKAVIIDTERFVLSSHKAYTYAPADFADDGDTVLIYDNIKADLSDLTVLGIEGKVKSGDIPDNLLVNGLVQNMGFEANDGALNMYEWALGKPILAGPITVSNIAGDYGLVTIPGSSYDKSYYMVAKVGGSWVMTELLPYESTTTEATTTEETSLVWMVLSSLIPDGTYTLGNCMIYEDLYGITGSTPSPVSVYLTINEVSTDTAYVNRLTEITNYGQIEEMYGTAAKNTRGNIAYSAAMFYLRSGGTKTFYIAPVSSDGIGELIEDLKTHNDAYYLIYNVGGYTENKADADALFAHVRVMSSPLYKGERRLYVKENMVGTTASALLMEKEGIINAALSLDNERASLIVDYAETDSFIKYCARRYSVNRDYSLTNEEIDIGNIWVQASNLSVASKNQLKDNGVVAFEQETPTSIPMVMYQTTTYIENDIIDKKEENIQIGIDELSISIRNATAKRVRGGMSNKVSFDPTSPRSKAYLNNLNADIAPVRTEFSSSFTGIQVLGAEIDQNDPRHVVLRVTAISNKTVNRIDVAIYVV